MYNYFEPISGNEQVYINRNGNGWRLIIKEGTLFSYKNVKFPKLTTAIHHNAAVHLEF